MAWSTEETKRRLMEAATAEFAARGLAGTTMEQIAKRAGINKERLYNYFGDKQRLFATVLSEELGKVAEAVPIDVVRDEDAGEYAGRCFDYMAVHPELIRLLQWEALEYGDDEVPDEVGRTEHYRQKVDSFSNTQHGGALSGQSEAAHLFSLVLAVSQWWFTVPQIARMVTGAPARNRAERDRRRASVVEAARRLTGTTDPPSKTSPRAG